MVIKLPAAGNSEGHCTIWRRKYCSEESLLRRNHLGKTPKLLSLTEPGLLCTRLSLRGLCPRSPHHCVLAVLGATDRLATFSPLMDEEIEYQEYVNWPCLNVAMHSRRPINPFLLALGKSHKLRITSDLNDVNYAGK